MYKPASDWLERNWEWLIKEYNNRWIGASSEGVVGAGESFDLALVGIRQREIALSEVVFVFLTEEAIQ